MTLPLSALASLATQIACPVSQGQRLIVLAPHQAAPLVERIAALIPDCTPIWENPDGLYRHMLEGNGRDEAASLERQILDMANAMADGAARLRILAPRPDILAGVDPSVLAQVHARLAATTALAEAMLQERTVQDAAIPYPTRAWAAQIWPGRAPEDSVAALQASLIAALRLDKQDPVAAWRDRLAALTRNAALLNARDLYGLRLTGGGTDLYLELAAGASWTDGQNAGGVETLPREALSVDISPGSARGQVCASRPIALAGERVEGLRLTFENGAIQAVEAKRGQAAFEGLLGLGTAPCRVLGLSLLDRPDPPVRPGEGFCNPLLDAATAHALVLCSGGDEPAPLRVEVFVDPAGLTVEGIDRTGATHVLAPNRSSPA